jgi:hypothetical protein
MRRWTSTRRSISSWRTLSTGASYMSLLTVNRPESASAPAPRSP